MEQGEGGGDGSSFRREAQPLGDASALDLPKGGGAIRGIGEKFSVHPASGTGAMAWRELE